MLELAAYQSGEDPDGRTERHLAECARCRALLITVSGLGQSKPAHAKSVGVIAARDAPDVPADIRTGQVWGASIEENPDWREIVVVLARQPSVDQHELVLVAPIDLSFDDAASTDVVVNESPLGYRHLVSVGQQGVVLRDQLETYLGRLDRPIRTALAATYQHVLAGAQLSDPEVPTAPPLAGPDDPRVWPQAVRADELRSLFAAASRLLGNEEEQTETLGTLLRLVCEGDSWDRQSVMTSAGLEGAAFDRMIRDDLDLTDQTDVGDVQRVINVIQLDDWRDPVRASLRRSRGGLRRANGGAELAIAARSFAGVSQTQRDHDLTRDQSLVDESPAAREQAIDSYMRSLAKELDDQT